MLKRIFTYLVCFSFFIVWAPAYGSIGPIDDDLLEKGIIISPSLHNVKEIKDVLDEPGTSGATTPTTNRNDFSSFTIALTMSTVCILLLVEFLGIFFLK